ncbi:hypothetical protein FRC01_009543 [Tulasnella sp. 417]|nr:hypothetical protein FRC01_009543 [Tulasnella sp. 417]
MGDANGGTPQSPTSSPLFFRRETIGNRDGIVLFNPSRTPEGNGPGPLVVPPLGQRNFTTDLAGEILHQTRKRTQSQFFLNEDEKHMLNAETVNWLLGITSKPEDLLIVAQNLCCLEFEARRIILQDSASWQRLLYFALDALQRWRDRPEQENKLTAEFLGAALCRLLMDEPRDGAKWREVRRQFKDKFFQSSKSSTSRVLSLSVLKSVLITSNNVWQEELKVAEYDLRKVFLQTQIFERRNEIWSILVGAIRVQYDDVILNLLAVLITARSDPSQSTSDLQALAIKAYNGKDLVQHLAAALTVHDKVFSAISDPRQLDALSEIYAAFMQKVHDYRRSNSNEVDGPSLDKLRQPLPDFILGLIKRVDVKKERCSFSWIRSVMKAVATVRAFEIDQTSRDAIYAALNYIITGSKTCRPEMDEFNLQQFTFSTLNAIARDIADLPPKSLGNEPGIIPYLVSAADGLDKWKWLTYFAEYPSIWMPNESKATELWKESPFIPNLLEGFKTTYDHRKQEELASIMVHIAKSKSSDWCTQLIITSDGLAQVVEESISSGSSARIPVVIALRPLLEVFDGPPIDWGTDLMYGIVRKLSASIVDKDSGLLGRLGEQDSGVDIATLIRFIKHVKGRRTYEGSSLATIEQALDCLSNIPRQPQPNKLVTS